MQSDFQGRFKLEPFLASNNLQWKRRLRGADGNTIAIHIVDERSAQKPQSEREDWQYNLAVRLSLPGDVPEIWRVETVKKIVPVPIVYPRADEIYVGQFDKKWVDLVTGTTQQWQRRLQKEDGTHCVHIVDERNQLWPENNTGFWQYRLVTNISSNPHFEIWMVELLKEIVVQPEESERRKRNKYARQTRAQTKIADLLKAQADRQKFRKELEARNAGGGKNKQGGGKKKSKQFANAS